MYHAYTSSMKIQLENSICCECCSCQQDLELDDSDYELSTSEYKPIHAPCETHNISFIPANSTKTNLHNLQVILSIMSSGLLS